MRATFAIACLVIGCKREVPAEEAGASPGAALDAGVVSKPIASIDWSWIAISRGVAIRTGTASDIPTPDQKWQPMGMSLAIFSAADGGTAVKLVDSGGTVAVELPAGAYEICAGGSSKPRCTTQDDLVGGGPAPVPSCRPDDKKCRCLPPDGSHKAWQHGCQRFDVTDGVVKLTATSAQFGYVAFSREL